MRLLTLLTTFQGRISRQPWWLGFAIWLIANLTGGYVFNPDLFTAQEIPPPNWPDTVWQLACLVPLTAVTVKRCHDRDWPSWLGYAFAAIFAFYIVGLQFGLPFDPQHAGLGKILYWSLATAQIGMLVDNGFFPGTKGPNRYGPDPLTPSTTTPQTP